MGKIVLSGPQNATLDGVVQDPDGAEGFEAGGWFVEFGGKDLEVWNELALADALGAEAWLLGRTSYELLRQPLATAHRGARRPAEPHPKYVVSSTLSQPEWDNTTVLSGDVVQAVARLKHEVQGEIIVPASYRLARLLIEHDLVDELRLVVFPVVLGIGERLFDATTRSKPLRLVDHTPVGDRLGVPALRVRPADIGPARSTAGARAWAPARSRGVASGPPRRSRRPRASGTEARTRALVEDDEALYHESITRLRRTGMRDRAGPHPPAYGEWLRRNQPPARRP